MSLVSVGLAPGAARLPADVGWFLREARRRIACFRHSHRGGGFVPSDFDAVYAALVGLEASGLLAGRWFCEWGSGFGVVSCLAAMLGFEAWGIEADGELVEEARLLADDFGAAAEFVHGSFIPDTTEARLWGRGEFAWLSTDGAGGHEAMGLGPEEFDLIFAFSWPDEEEAVSALFDERARPGAMLLTYAEGDGLALRRKITRGPRRLGTPRRSWPGERRDD